MHHERGDGPDAELARLMGQVGQRIAELRIPMQPMVDLPHRTGNSLDGPGCPGPVEQLDQCLADRPE